MFWGSLSDRIGRKKVLLLGSAGTLISLVILGFAQNFWIALLGRILGGLLNGNIGVIQTMVGELVKNPKHERKYFAFRTLPCMIGRLWRRFTDAYSSSFCCHAICLVYWNHNWPCFRRFAILSFFILALHISFYERLGKTTISSA